MNLDQCKIEKTAKSLGFEIGDVLAALMPVDQEAINQIVTPAEASALYQAQPDYSETKRLALEKWNNLSKKQVEKSIHFDEAETAYKDAPEGSEAQLLAMEKLNILCRQLVDKADDLDAVEAACFRSSKCSEAEHLAIIKFYELVE